jgi:hypothetical protein
MDSEQYKAGYIKGGYVSVYVHAYVCTSVGCKQMQH